MPLRPTKIARGAGTGGSAPVECCQICGHAPLDDVLSLGYMPPVNQMVRIGAVPLQQLRGFRPISCTAASLRIGRASAPWSIRVIIFPPGISLHQRQGTAAAGDNFADLHQ